MRDFLLVSILIVGCKAPDVHVTPDPILDSGDELEVTAPSLSMIEVEGDYCLALEEKCLDPGWDGDSRCFHFQSPSVCRSKAVHKHFWMDKYEYPNIQGVKPMRLITWYEARRLCQLNGKRLCTDSEWTLACEGQERLPYPYGYDRDSTACNIDHTVPGLQVKFFEEPGPIRNLWLEKTDLALASGGSPGCVSPFGVYDLTGNLDEWVVNESGRPFISGLKGGFWGPVRTRCRPMTVAHGPDFSFYQLGARCCRNVD